MFVRGGTILVCLAWPVSLHLAILAERQSWMPAITAGALIAVLFLWAISHLSRLPAACIAGGTTIALLVYAPGVLLYAPPTVINAVLALYFYKSLRAEPVISVYARLEQETLTPELRHYTRRITEIWCAAFATMAMTGLALALFAPLSTWSLFSNVVCYGIVTLLIVVEYGYRRVRFPHYRHASIFTLLKNICTRRIAAEGANNSQ